MKLKFLKLVNFRNYDRLDISFHPVLNLIYGKNGAGKTNLVEAIYVLSLTRSFRYVGDKTLIRDEEKVAKVEGIVNLNYDTSFEVLLSKEGKKVKVNHNKVAKISDYISKITVVLFHPDDLRFIKDTPSTRRKTLNISISLIHFEYLKMLGYYKNLLKQRNAYLKQMMINGNLDGAYLDILTEKLVHYGMQIHEKRLEFLKKLNSYLGEFYEKITGISGLQVEYLSDYNDLTKEEIMEKLKKGLQKDLLFGKTNFGIHTDDLRFLLNGKDLKEYGSEGQQKNAIIAYKFSELELFKEFTGNYPIFILDDLFSELDEEKIANILNLLKKDVQTFITTTEIDWFLKKNVV